MISEVFLKIFGSNQPDKFEHENTLKFSKTETFYLATFGNV